jgi:outer membrane protein assembly factor BamB
MKVAKYIKKGKKLITYIKQFVLQVLLGSLRRAFTSNKNQNPLAAGMPPDAPLPTGPELDVRPVESTRPEAFGFETELFLGGKKVETYNREVPVRFGPGRDYSPLQGIVTFRGNNYRDTASYGAVNVQKGTLTPIWKVKTGKVERSAGTRRRGRRYWTGSGWTGQPIIIKWPEDLRELMNIYPDKKADPDLVEVIYACMDGVVYFVDLKDGKPTRPPIKTGGGPVKGTASLYPDGTPMLFVGPADDPPGMEAVRARIYSLTDQKQIYTFGHKDPESYRVYQSYDSSPLYDAAADTVIEPGENGLLYTIELNTTFDREAGTLTVDPAEPVKFRYKTPEYKDSPKNTPGTRWWGMEDSACVWRNYLYIADNGGKLMCIDLNTMELKWVQDVLDDTNTSPVFEESPEEGTCHIYISTSLHITATGDGLPRNGGVPIWKIDAATGEVVWRTPAYPCQSMPGVSGGVQGTPVLGRHDISNLVIYPVAHTPEEGRGILVALDKKTGEEVWKTRFKNYCWSSPAAVYTPDGKSYIIQCDSDGYMYLIEGISGKIVSSVYLWSNIEASPAVFGNIAVVGTRRRKIYAVRIG